MRLSLKLLTACVLVVLGAGIFFAQQVPASITLDRLPNPVNAVDTYYYVSNTTDCLTVAGTLPLTPTECHSDGTAWTVVGVLVGPTGSPLTLPTGPGVLYGNGSSVSIATAANIVAAFNSGTCSGFLKSDGTCATFGGGAATSFLAVPLLSGTPTDGQAYVYSGANHDFEPIAIPHWQKFPVAYTQLTGFNSTSVSIVLMGRAARQKVCGASLFSTVAYAAPGLTGLGVVIGDSNATTNFYTPASLDLRDSGTIDFNVMGSAVGTSNITATFTAVGANLSALTAGGVDIDLCLATLP